MYQIGNQKNLKIYYTITNDGETAFYPQLIITILTKGTVIHKQPNGCDTTKDDQIIITCNIQNGRYIETKKKVNVEFELNLNLVEDNELVMIGNVTDKSSDKNLENNLVKNTLKLERQSNVNVFR